MMAASTPLVNSPHAALGRVADMPFMSRPKRSDSTQIDFGSSRAFDPQSSRNYEAVEEDTFIPTTISEHLLERTYLDDVVRPLVRALVKARMTYASAGSAGAEQAQVYADLEKLRQELQRSAQRTRHAEQERDDLARRLDLAGVPEAGFREPEPRDRGGERRIDPLDSEASPHPSRIPVSASSSGLKRSRQSESDAMRNSYDHRSSGAGPTGVSVNVAHGEGPGASITVTTEGPGGTPVNISSRPNNPSIPAVDALSPPAGYSNISSRHRSYPDIVQEHERGQRHPPRLPPPGPNSLPYDHDRHYGDERERYGPGTSGSSAHRSSLSRYPGPIAQSPTTASSYLPSERSSIPTLSTFPSTASSSAYSATPYSSVHSTYEQDMEMEAERARKYARMRPSDPMTSSSHSLSAGRPLGPPAGYMITPAPEPASYPVRKLAATKNRTCSNCSAPHDAKFRRGPNGPGTLCDRCGSRWKKFKEQEAAMQNASKREHHSGPDGPNSASAAANAAAQARLSSVSSSSQSPMDGPLANTNHSHGKETYRDRDMDRERDREMDRERDRDSEAPLATSTEASHSGPSQSSSAQITPDDNASSVADKHHLSPHDFKSPSKRDQELDERMRERSHSPDQLNED